MNQGKLIVIEGACDGIGKTTQFQLLIDKYTKEGKKVVSHHFPTYGSYQSRPAEEYLKGSLGNKDDLSPYCINSIFALDRAITWFTDLSKKYEDGSTIILDRYTTSSVIYQSAFIDDMDKKKAFIDYVIDYEFNKLGIKKPDFVIFLKADFDVIQNMIKNREEVKYLSNDIYENDIEYLKKVCENSTFVANYLNWDIVECTKDGKLLSIEEIHNKIYEILNNK